MDDIKLFAKNEEELETLKQAVRIYSEEIGMKLSIEKWARLIMKSGKQEMTEGIKLPNQEKIRTLREGNLQILGNIRSGHHQTCEDERKKKKKKKNTPGEQENYSKPNYIDLSFQNKNIKNLFSIKYKKNRLPSRKKNPNVLFETHFQDKRK